VLAAVSEVPLAFLAKRLAVVLTADEEIGCVGAKHLVREQAIRSRYAVIGEPTGLRPIRAGKGYALAEIVVRGREAHSAFPAQGRSAIYDAAYIISAIEMLSQRVALQQNPDFDPPFTTLNAGLIQGGTAKNIVPGECRITMEWRPIPGQDPAWVADQLRAEISKCARERPGLKAELNVLRSDPPFEPGATHNLASILESISNRTATTVAFGTEAAHLSPLMEEIVVFGPGDMTTAHRTGENVPIDELLRCVGILRTLIERLCA
jgi:acetylornithine deacetylase